MSGKNATEDDNWGNAAFSDDEEEDEEQEETLQFYPLCCRTTSDVSASFSTLADALQHDLDVNNFDVFAQLPSASDDEFFEKAIIMVNKCRDFVLRNKQEEDIGTKLTEYMNSAADDQDNEEEFFKPVLADDAVLMCMDELEFLTRQQEQGSNRTATNDENKDLGEIENKSSASELQMRVSALEEQLARAKACISSLTNDTGPTKPPKRDNDTYYFSSYSHHSIHETMLQDVVRTTSYEKAILSNSESLFKDKVVLDIGCGTGVLSIFAAKAGARKVIAIDGSDIIKEARAIVAANGYGDGTITCVSGKVEDLIATPNALPLEENEKVDVIVSEWMGHALFFESMLPSVMVARDAIMNETGTMYPNRAAIFLEGAVDSRLAYWENVYGIDMTAMQARTAKELTTEASVEIVDADKIVTNRVELTDFDLNKCRDQDLDFDVPFELKARRAGLRENEVVKLDKLVISFDIIFDVPKTNELSFSTGCQSKPTHWKQTTLWFDPVVDVPVLQNGDVLRGSFKMGRNKKNHRGVDFDVIWEVGSNKAEDGSFVCRYNGSIATKYSA